MKVTLAYRSLTPFEGSGKSDMVHFVPVFGGRWRDGTADFEEDDSPISDVHSRGSWNADDDEDHSYREDADDYKLQERLREVLERTRTRKPERWTAVDEDGKGHSFDSMEEAHRSGRKWKSVSRTAQAISTPSDSSAEAVAAAIQSCVMVESVPTVGTAEIGSAFSIGGGLFITCAHVVKRYDKMKMPAPLTAADSRLTLHQFGRSWPATLVAADLTRDVAVLRSNAPLPALSLGVAGTKAIGSSLVAVGSPRGFENNVSTGILSSKNRRIYNYPGASSYIFTDAQILPGSSGGPLLYEEDGTVIGVVSLIVAGEGLYGLNAALPAEEVSAFLRANNLG